MLRLMILRHLKTGWALPGQRDFDRRLEARGIEDAAIVSRWIGDLGLAPDHVYCSDAERTRDTLRRIERAFSRPPAVTFHNALYSGTSDDYLEAIERHPQAESLMIVGHNPSCAALANQLIDRNAIARGSGGQADPSMNAISYKYPTGALAVIDFDIADWSKVRPGSGRLVKFLMPKEFPVR
ncbi:MAG: histidine phosphatase family protein [Nitratireductor sp.]|nr:histidine phosphatase family protein [Nitratireductor sp.]